MTEGAVEREKSPQSHNGGNIFLPDVVGTLAGSTMGPSGDPSGATVRHSSFVYAPFAVRPIRRGIGPVCRNRPTNYSLETNLCSSQGGHGPAHGGRAPIRAVCTGTSHA